MSAVPCVCCEPPPIAIEVYGNAGSSGHCDICGYRDTGVYLEDGQLFDEGRSWLSYLTPYREYHSTRRCSGPGCDGFEEQVERYFSSEVWATLLGVETVYRCDTQQGYITEKCSDQAWNCYEKEETLSYHSPIQTEPYDLIRLDYQKAVSEDENNAYAYKFDDIWMPCRPLDGFSTGGIRVPKMYHDELEGRLRVHLYYTFIPGGVIKLNLSGVFTVGGEVEGVPTVGTVDTYDVEKTIIIPPLLNGYGSDPSKVNPSISYSNNHVDITDQLLDIFPFTEDQDEDGIYVPRSEVYSQLHNYFPYADQNGYVTCHLYVTGASLP